MVQSQGSVSEVSAGPPKVAFWNDPVKRGYFFQIALFLVIAFLFYEAATNAIDNLRKQKIASGFGFWNITAGFDIGQRLIPYSNTSNYGQAFWVGLTNTLLVASIGIVLATLLGFTIGIARLSKNWLVEKIASIYVEVIRNTPLLLQLLFWYNAVLKALPEFRDSAKLPFNTYLNNRGLFMPDPSFGADFKYVLMAGFGGLVAYFLYSRWARLRQARTGQQAPRLIVAWILLVMLPVIVFLIMGRPLIFTEPTVGRFNMQGGLQIFPEFVALVAGLVIYTAAFIAEAVRAGIQAVSKGQTEAAYALGLRPGPTLDLVVVPQAMRVIIPPLTSQFLNLTKNSSLAVAIGYPDLVQVFTGTVLNQTGQAVEVIAITMLVYLTLSLSTSLFMNWYNARKALVER
ncbi:BatB ABC-type amino acid transport system, permease component [Rhabdaerophilaceae bacterium]